jgi:hypothetical protein
VWAGNELKRYPKRYKDTARKRHRTLFREMGLDAEAIENDDPSEVLRLSILSWKKFEENVNRRHKSDAVVTPLFSHSDRPKVETPENGVDTHPDEPSKEVATREPSAAVLNPREPSAILPVMGLGKADPEDDESPETLNIRSESARVCNSCFLAEKCPAYQPDSNCAYNIPIQIRTRQQVKALRQGMLEMQTQRVMFMRFTEEIEGGYADPNLTKEMGLLDKMIAQYEEAEREGFNISVNVRGNAQQAQAGVFSRLFGNDAGEAVGAIEGSPQQADDIIDAEILDDEGSN